MRSARRLCGARRQHRRGARDLAPRRDWQPAAQRHSGWPTARRQPHRPGAWPAQEHLRGDQRPSTRSRRGSTAPTASSAARSCWRSTRWPTPTCRSSTCRTSRTCRWKRSMRARRRVAPPRWRAEHQGGGRIVYFPWNIGEIFWEVLAADHSRLIANAVRWALGKRLDVEVKGRERARSRGARRRQRHRGGAAQSHQPDDDEGPDPRASSLPGRRW